jgi:hypothetical protein
MLWTFRTLLLGTIILTGCGGSTLKISRVKTPPPPEQDDESAPLPGIPFFMKSAGCKHQTVWLQPVYTLSLSISEKSPGSGAEKSDTPQGASPTGGEDTKKPPEVFTKVLSLKQFNDSHDFINKLQQELSRAKSESGMDISERLQMIRDTWDKIISSGAYNPFAEPDDKVVASPNVIRVSNTVAPETYVDYTTTYYLNSSKPLAGSSQASFKLADDGTLTEGAAQVETKTLPTFLELVPFKDVITKLAAPPGFIAAPSYEVELKIETKAYKRTHSAMVRQTNSGATEPGKSGTSPIKEDSAQSQEQGSSQQRRDSNKISQPRPSYVAPPCEFPQNEVTTASYKNGFNSTIEEISVSEESKPDGNTAKVSGTIQLPKPATGAEKKK